VADESSGDAIVPTAFEGVPVYRYDNMAIIGELDPEARQPVYALFWHVDGYESDAWDDGIEQPATRLPLEVFTFTTFNLFEHPADHMLAETHGQGRYGLGVIQAYDDANANGRYDDEIDRWLGFAHQGLLYVPEALDADASPTGLPLARGYHRVDYPISCVPVIEGDDDACEVPLGAACWGDEDCGEGLCLGQGFFVDEGHCALADSACSPEGGALSIDFVDPIGLTLTWLQGCRSHVDCGVADGRYCDVSLGACLPDQGMVLEVGIELPEAPCKLIAQLIREDEEEGEEDDGEDEDDEDP